MNTRMRTVVALFTALIAQPALAQTQSVHLGTNATVCPSDGPTNLLSVTVPLQPETGDTLYLFAKTTARRTYTGNHTANLLDYMQVVCPGSTVTTTRNHRGTDSPDQASPGMRQYVSHLHHPDHGESEVTCTLRVGAMGSGDRGCLVFQAGSSNTWLHSYVRTGGWAWGTNLDAHNALDNHGHAVTIIGPGVASETGSYPTGETMDLGTSEYVLKGRRVSADPSARSLDVYSDIQMTCESDEGSCNVTAKLLVQRMKSPTSSTVCHVTEVSQSKTISAASHHQKLHLNAYGVGFNVTCGDGSLPVGRSFIVKSLVALNSGNDNEDYVIVEHGTHDDPSLIYSSGYSTTIVLQNF